MNADNDAQLEVAIGEAERFLDRATIAIDKFAADPEACWQSPHFAAAKRASLDLTRALADLRR